MVSQKISQFNVSTSLSTSDLFTFVVNGTNKSITFSDFKASLGVTGEISQDGDPLGAPILYNEAVGAHRIRNIESSKGVIANISAQNGVVIGANFTQSALGESIIENLNSSVYRVRTLVGGTGINIAVVGDTIEISLS